MTRTMRRAGRPRRKVPQDYCSTCEGSGQIRAFPALEWNGSAWVRPLAYTPCHHCRPGRDAR